MQAVVCLYDRFLRGYPDNTNTRAGRWNTDTFYAHDWYSQANLGWAYLPGFSTASAADKVVFADYLWPQDRLILLDAIKFMETCATVPAGDLNRVELFTSHEGLNLWYEQAQTRQVPRR